MLSKQNNFLLNKITYLYYTLLICGCDEEWRLLLLLVWDPDGVPVDDLVLLVDANNLWSGLLIFVLFAVAFEFDDVDVILHTDTAFFRYFLSLRVVPFVIPTS